MNTPWSNAASLAGRILLAAIFIQSSYGKIGGFEGTVKYMASKGLPASEVLLPIAIAIELVGGILLVIGWKARWAAAAIFLFLVPTTLVFHNFLGLEGAEARQQMIHFMKNLAIMGGMLTVIAHGPGGWSLDRR